MGRLILFVLAVLALLWLLRRALGARGGGAPGPRGGGAELVQCAHCGVHLPRAEARGAGDTVYCSEEHARLGPRAR